MQATEKIAVIDRSAALQQPIQSSFCGPVVIRGAITGWPAIAAWSPTALKERFGTREYNAQVNLPTRVPSMHLSKDYTRRMRLDEFIGLMLSTPADRPCYLHQRSIAQFPSLEHDVRFEEFTGPAAEPTDNLWIGSAGTKTSLHFDYQHGILAQVFGTKRLLLIAPEHSRYLHVLPGIIQKSQVDAEAPDLKLYQKYAKAKVFEGVIEPGDAIFIPRGWWHMVRALSASISVNHFFGPKLATSRLLRHVVDAGPATWGAFLRDFFWHGLCRVRYEGRLYSEEPIGVWLYSEIERRIRGGRPVRGL